MNKVILLSTISLVCFFFSSCEKYPCPPDPAPVVISPDTVSPEPVIITVTLQGSSASRSALLEGVSSDQSNNYGSSQTLLAGIYPSMIAEERSLLDFNYSSIPANAIIKKATLTLYADITNIYTYYSHQGHYYMLPNTNAWILKRVVNNWDPSTVTWNTSPAFDNVNQILLSESNDGAQNYIVDVTTLVTDQIKNPSSYYGFMMLSQGDTHNLDAVYVSFCSTTYTDPQLRPKLEIQYQLP